MKEEEDIVTLYRYNLFGKNNELTVSVDSAIDKHGRRPAAVYVKLTKDGRAAGESVFPLSGNCPIEEDIGVEVSDKGFIIRIPYCDGHMFRIGYARFGYSEKYDDFILTELQGGKYRQTGYRTEKQECRIQYLIRKSRLYSPCFLPKR